MNINDFHKKLSELFTIFNQTIKPLIADIETKYQECLPSIFNEIRSFNDHIARCYIEGISDTQLNKEIERAISHINRITFDSYKILIIWFHDYFNSFKADFDISLIDNGEFAPYFYKKQSEGRELAREAKRNETYDKQLAFDQYQEAYIVFSELYTSVQAHLPRIEWAKKIGKYQFRVDIFKNIWFWITSFVISTISGLLVYLISK